MKTDARTVPQSLRLRVKARHLLEHPQLSLPEQEMASWCLAMVEKGTPVTGQGRRRMHAASGVASAEGSPELQTGISMRAGKNVTITGVTADCYCLRCLRVSIFACSFNCARSASKEVAVDLSRRCVSLAPPCARFCACWRRRTSLASSSLLRT